MGSYDFPHGGKIKMGNNLESAFFTEQEPGAQNIATELWVSASLFCT